jgi:hypothetical protein
MRQFQSVINNAIPVITQTVITVLQQNGCIPKTSNTCTATSTTCTEVTNGRDSSVHLPRSQTESTSVGTNSGNNGNFISTAMATNNCTNENVVDNLLQTGTYNNLQTTCSNDMSKKVGLARPLSLGVDSKIQAQIWANEYIEFESLLKLENQKTKFVPEEREDQIVFTKQKIGTFKIDNMTQWLAAFHIFVAIYCERYPMEASNLMKYAHIITSLSKQSGIEGALCYDRSFRQWRQKDPVNLPWEGVVTELHCEALAMGLQTKWQNNSYGNKQPFRGIFGRPRTGGPITTKQHCYSFNNEGYCRNQKCHFCQVCKQESHGKKFCPISETTNKLQTNAPGKPKQFTSKQKPNSPQ